MMEIKQEGLLEKVLLLNKKIESYQRVYTFPNGYKKALGTSIYESLEYLHKKIVDELIKDKEEIKR
jgi:hypothetical protein